MPMLTVDTEIFLNFKSPMTFCRIPDVTRMGKTAMSLSAVKQSLLDITASFGLEGILMRD